MFQYTPYTIPLLVALVLAGAGTLIAWSRRDGGVETWSVALQVSVFLWVLLNLLLVSSTTLAWKLLFHHLFLPVIGLVIVTAMGFTLHFTGRADALTRRRLALLFAFPMAILLLSVTNQYHELILVNPTLDTSGSITLLTYEYGPGLYAVILISYAIATVYGSLLLVHIRRSRNVYRKLSVVLFVMVFLMTAVTVPKALGVSPFPYWILFCMLYLVVGLGTIVATTSIRVIRALPIDRLFGYLSAGTVVPLARDIVLQEVDTGILVLDSNGRVVDANTRAKKMIDEERPIGKRLAAITDPSITRGSDRLHSMIWGDAPLEELQDQVWIDLDDGEVCYDVRVTVLTDDTNTLAGYVILLSDITDQKRHEEELQRQRNELQTQTQQLEHQNEQLDRFASIVSHDLRNPLNVASGYVELMNDQAVDESDTVEVDADQLSKIHSSHERMADIIDDALTLAREGKAITETTAVDLNEVVTDAWESVDTEGLTLEIVDSAGIEADRDRLLTVFENLFRNSLEHGTADSSPDSTASDTVSKIPGDITVRVGLLDQGGFYVEDDGGGITEDKFDKLFDHGYTTSNEGTGLGLSIVQDIVKGHGWAIHAFTAANGGARFEITGVEVTPADPSDQMMTSTDQ